ncbi:MAG: ergothioneine biosynthesis protein EgtB [Pseudomonadota bacterium]
MLGGPGGAQLPETPQLERKYREVRAASVALCETLAPEDFVVQSMPDVSPTKWHLAHITWFFERFVLKPNLEGYRPFNEKFDFIFNSYYYTVGQMHQRPRRGLLSRPTVDEVMAYRRHVDSAMDTLLHRPQEDSELNQLVTLGLHHEQQHQELILTDIRHVLFQNPLEPAFRPPRPVPSAKAPPMKFIAGPDGLAEIGHEGQEFAFDNETPRHRVLLQPHAIANRPVTNWDFREFILDGGYRECRLWLSDGWSKLQSEGWERPLYWSEDLRSEFTLAGRIDLDDNAPVSNLSYYEADAFASWAEARLPTEAEWEVAAANEAIEGNFVDNGNLRPVSAAETGDRQQLFGDVWEWTRSPYAPYPGFKPLAGSLGEYNGKFMCSQLVLKGGSCATPLSHIRSTYRNFFYPDTRWQFSGLRLARDL